MIRLSFASGVVMDPLSTRTVIRGLLLVCRTLSATLPRAHRAMPARPWVDMVTTESGSFSASATISAAGFPSRTVPVTASPVSRIGAATPSR